MTDNAGEYHSDPPRPPILAMESVAGRRPYQEDGVLAEPLPDGRTLVAVADGMGGHAAGEVASARALESLVSGMRDGKTLEEAFHLANSRVFAEARDPGKQGMGTTLVAVLLSEDTFVVANVGDSRAYFLTRDGVRQLTEDHSFLAEAVRSGESVEEAMASRWKDALTRAVGTTPEVEVDLFGPFPVQEDAAVLLCSDGLYKTLGKDDIHVVVSASTGPEDACRALAAEAYERGSDDNITVAMAYFGDRARSASPGETESMASASPGMVETGDPDQPDGQEREEEPEPDAVLPPDPSSPQEKVETAAPDSQDTEPPERTASEARIDSDSKAGADSRGRASPPGSRQPDFPVRKKEKRKRGWWPFR